MGTEGCQASKATGVSRHVQSFHPLHPPPRFARPSQRGRVAELDQEPKDPMGKPAGFIQPGKLCRYEWLNTTEAWASASLRQWSPSLCLLRTRPSTKSVGRNGSLWPIQARRFRMSLNQNLADWVAFANCKRAVEAVLQLCFWRETETVIDRCR